MIAKISYTIGLVVLLLLTIASSEETRLDSDVANIGRGILDFGQRIVAEALNERNKSSEIIAPLSIAGVMYLLQLGAARNTSVELQKLLGISERKFETKMLNLFNLCDSSYF